MSTINGYTLFDSLDSERPNYDELITRYAPLVKRIAYHIKGRLPASVLFDDMVQAGMVGLFEALKAYDTTRGASFETYARIRIQGSMIDEVRRCDWVPRSVYRKSREISEAIREVERREGRDAKDSEIAAVLNVDLQEYYSLVQDAAGCQVLSFDDIAENLGGCRESADDEEKGPYHALQNEDFKVSLAQNIAQLPERERMVMALYYDEEFNLREIGEILGVTEGRVCQIHSQALSRLRARMTSWVENSLCATAD
jgi:RNA polymerase sigma factor for flagellar operon FliA